MTKTTFIAGKPAPTNVLPETSATAVSANIKFGPVPEAPTFSSTGFTNPGPVPQTIAPIRTTAPAVPSTAPAVMPTVPVPGFTMSPTLPNIPIATQPVKGPAMMMEVKTMVVDESGRPIKDAIAFVAGAKSGPVSDDKGMLVIKGEAMQNVVISYLGFKPETYVIAGVPSKVVLKDGQSYDLEGITVTQVRQPETKKKKFPWLLVALGLGAAYMITRKSKPVKASV